MRSESKKQIAKAICKQLERIDEKSGSESDVWSPRREVVPSEGLEPPRREAPDSKPGVATNYTNWAHEKQKLLETEQTCQGTA